MATKSDKKKKEFSQEADQESLDLNTKVKAAKNDDEEDDDNVEEEADEWEKPVEEDEWDPDFAEFDLPKSSKRGGKKVAMDDEDDFKVDDEFKDLFSNSSSGFDDEDDDY